MNEPLGMVAPQPGDAVANEYDSVAVLHLGRPTEPGVDLAQSHFDGRRARDNARLACGNDRPALGVIGNWDLTDFPLHLWAQILSANAGPVGSVLRRLRSDLDRLIEALDAIVGKV